MTTTAKTSDKKKTARIIHEIKQPLSAMTMLAELALDDMDKPAGANREQKLATALREIKTKGERCSRIIEKMRNADSDEAYLKNAEWTDINTVITRALSAPQFEESSHDILMSIKLADNIPEIEIDRDAIFQLITNLVANAIDSMKYSAEKILTVTSFKTEGGVGINVADTGCGIKQEDNTRIFDSYYTTKGDDGTGLGLSICKNIVNDHKGSINVSSEQHAGTQFNVLLPYR